MPTAIEKRAQAFSLRATAAALSETMYIVFRWILSTSNIDNGLWVECLPGSDAVPAFA